MSCQTGDQELACTGTHFCDREFVVHICDAQPSAKGKLRERHSVSAVDQRQGHLQIPVDHLKLDQRIELRYLDAKMAPEHTFETTAEELTRKYAHTIKGKVILTTGVSPGGIGSTFVESIATANPSLLVLASRNPSKAQEVANAINIINPEVQIRILKLDLCSLASVRKAAETVNSWSENVDVLVSACRSYPSSRTTSWAEAFLSGRAIELQIFNLRSKIQVNNAGVMGVPWALSPEGHERTLTTNWLGPFLFTNLIMSKILKSSSPRIVMIGSEGHRWNPIRWGDYDFQVSPQV